MDGGSGSETATVPGSRGCDVTQLCIHSYTTPQADADLKARAVALTTNHPRRNLPWVLAAI